MTAKRRERIINLLVGYEVDILWYRRDDAQNREGYEFFYTDYLMRKTDAELFELKAQKQADERTDKELKFMKEDL
jgi:hypothetical protein